jgi:hypothetical protein
LGKAAFLQLGGMGGTFAFGALIAAAAFRFLLLYWATLVACFTDE